jgi:phosphoribosylglycinamide formyltransferase 1
MSAESLTGEPHKLGVLASGAGSNFVAIDDAIRDGRLQNTQIAVVLSDREDAGALVVARERGIPAIFLGDVDNDRRNTMIYQTFYDSGVELGVGAGYLQLVGQKILEYCDVLNIHPAPLPKFGGKGMFGKQAHQAVIDSGASWSGPTVHLMNEVFDEGQILAHVQVPVLTGDTAGDLAARILPYEHDLYWRVIARQLARGTHPEAST